MRTAAFAFAFAAALLVLAAAPASQSRERNEEEQKRALLSYLNAHEFTVDERVLEAIGPDVNRLLVHVASDRNVRPTVRGRAVAALRVYPTKRTKKFLEGLLYERSLVGSSAGTLIRRETLRTLGRAFGEESVHAIADLRESSEPQIREGVAQGLGATGSPTALRILEGWLHHEPKLFVRLAVDEAITRLREEGGGR
ncbi:MAG: HEAT repeat domain-containing protein [Myxococcota bacterium]